MLKAIFAERYVPDYDANTNNILSLAIEAYNEANQTDVTVATVKEIVARAKSTVDDRTILSGVHYKINEIAKILKTREGTVKSQLSRAREMLKELMEGGFENE